MAKTPNDFDVRPMTVRHEDGKPAFPVVISMPSKEAGIAIENMGRSSLAMVAAYFYNLGREDGLEVMPIACADCGRDIRDEYDDGGRSGQCPGCDRYLCHSCADWDNAGGNTVCRECYVWEGGDDDVRD